MRPHMFIYFSCYFDIDQGHSSSKQIEKENKPWQKVIGLDNTIKNRFSWSGLKKGMENNIFWPHPLTPRFKRNCLHDNKPL